MLHRTAILASAALLSLLSAQASAFKLETHILQARYIWQEIKDSNGSVRITPTDSRAVPAYVRDSILANPNLFSISVLGADIYPDMVAGQLTTHPGLWDAPTGARVAPGVNEVMMVLGRSLDPKRLERPWRTDDWIRHVRTQAFGGSSPPQRGSPEIAFAAGYMLHTSMDMWAHTYVNTYAGGAFELGENAARHMAIESFIKHRHPDMLTLGALQSQSDAVGTIGRISLDARRAIGVVTRPPSGPQWFNDMRAPTEFVRRTLILNRQASEQYVRLPQTLHLWSMYTYWAEVDRLGRDFGGVQTSIQGAIEDAARAVDSAEGAWRTAQGAYNTAVRAADTAFETFKRAERDAQRAADGLAAAAKPLIDMLGQAFESLMSQAPAFLRGPYEDAKRTARAAEDALTSARRNYDRLREDRDAKQTQMDEALRTVNLRKETRNALQNATRIRLPLINDAIRDWRGSIERAVDAYILAWEDTAKETMRPKGNRFQPGGDPTGPLKEWVLCYGPTFGMPAIPGTYPATCREALSSYNKARSQIEQLVVAAVLPAQLRQAIIDYDKAIQKVSGELIVAIGKTFSDTLRLDANGEIGGFARTIVNLRDSEAPTPAALDDEYDDDTSGSGLLIFASPKNVSKLVQQDLTASPGTVNTIPGLEKFAALQNSMTMSRLALLDGAGINAIVSDRMDLAAIGNRAPYPANEPVGAILIGALASIDGDHQWQPQAPSMPRNPNAGPPSAPEPPVTPDKLRFYGYPNAAATDRPGLRLWNVQRIRECVWEQIMHGPLTPGLLSEYENVTRNFQQIRNSYPSTPARAAATGCKTQTPRLIQPTVPSVPSVPTRPLIRPGS
jgi:hypothetical protein